MGTVSLYSSVASTIFLTRQRQRLGAIFFCAALSVSCGGGGGAGTNSSPSPVAGGSPPPVTVPNRSPVLTRAPSQHDELALIGFPYDYDVTEGGTAFSDPDGDLLFYEVRNESTPADGCDLSIVGTHVKGNATKLGRCGIQVFARDGRGGELGIFLWINQDLNKAPVASRPNPNVVVLPGAQIDYDATQNGATFTDPDRSQLTYEVSIVEGPANFRVEGTRIIGSLSGPGYAKVKITASDNYGGVVEDSFAFVVPSPISARPLLPVLPYVYEEAKLTLTELLELSDGKVGWDDTTRATNPISDAGATLGRVLFYDKRLSITNTHSCGSCHSQSHNFGSAEVFPKGSTGVAAPRTPMPLANVRFNNYNRFFGDGRGITLENSVLMPIQDREELGSSILADLERKLANTDFYPPLFMAAFGTTEITSTRIGNALAQFLRSMITYEAKWDAAHYAVPPGPRPDSATILTVQEQRGFQVYLDSECFWCHQPGQFQSSGLENNGLDGAVSELDPSAKKLRVASLRNIAASAPYMHDGRFSSLREVIDHYSTGIQKNPNLGIFLLGADRQPKVFNLSNQDKDALEAFLNTLTDAHFLSNPKFSDPF